MNTTTMNTQENILSNILSNVVNSTKKTGCRFASFTYTNQHGETSRYNVILGINIVSLYKSDLRMLESLYPQTKGITSIACKELIDSLKNSLTKGIGNNDHYTLKGYYTPVSENGEVKLHKDEETGVTSFCIRGYVLKKTVIVPGTYKKVNSSVKTIEKDKIRKTMKQGKFRTFSINVSQVHSVKMNGMTLEIQ